MPLDKSIKESGKEPSPPAAGLPRADYVLPDGSTGSVLLSPPPSCATKRTASPTEGTPTPPKLEKQIPVKPKRKPKVIHSPAVRVDQLQEIFAPTVSAMLPRLYADFMSHTPQVDPVVASRAAAGETGGVQPRSGLDIAKVTTVNADPLVVDFSDVATGADRAAGQLAAPVLGPTHPALPSQVQLAGPTYSLLAQPSVSSLPSSGWGRPATNFGASAPPSGTVAPGTERSATLPFPGAPPSLHTPLPAQVGGAFPVPAGSARATATVQQTSAASGLGQLAQDNNGRLPPSYGGQDFRAAAQQPQPLAPGAVQAPPFQPAPVPAQPNAPLPAAQVDDDAASQSDNDASGSGNEARAEPDLSELPFHEVMELFSTFLPRAVVKEETPITESSFFPSLTAQAAKGKVVQSPLVELALQRAMAQVRGGASALGACPQLPAYPGGLRPGKFARARAPGFLKVGIADGPVPRAPPPLTQSDKVVTSSTPGQSVTVPMAQLVSQESAALSALDLVSLGDVTLSSLANALFLPGTTEFNDDTSPVQVWRLLQFMALLQDHSARILANAFTASLCARRDHVLASASTLSPEIQTSLRLAPVSHTSLFGPAAHAAATVATQDAQTRALHSFVNMANQQAAKSQRGSGSRSNRGRGASAGHSNNSSGRSQQKGRGQSRSRRGGKGKGAGKGRQAAAASTATAKSDNPQ